jgi:hypothetical protein
MHPQSPLFFAALQLAAAAANTFPGGGKMVT